jgi:hypothetical protein
VPCSFVCSPPARRSFGVDDWRVGNGDAERRALVFKSLVFIWKIDIAFAAFDPTTLGRLN